MAIIKNLAFVSKSKLKNLVPYLNFGLENTVQGPFLADAVHSLLPLKLKFLKESYVIIENNEVLGLITVKRDDTAPKRIKITEFSLKENCSKQGEILINEVTNRFFKKGAESFLVSIDEETPKILRLFQDGAKFRPAGDEFLFTLKKSDFTYYRDFNYPFIRFSKNSEAEKIAELCNGVINSSKLPTFELDPNSFKDNIFVGIKGCVNFKYVLENTSNGKLFGYFSISTSNNKEYTLEAILRPSYEIYLADILKFVKHEVSKRTTGWVLNVKIRSCFTNYNALIEAMIGCDFYYDKKLKILTKDLFKTAYAENQLPNKQMIFNDITPAF